VANPQHVALVKRGSTALDDRSKNVFERLDLYRARLPGVDLAKADLAEANLAKANLSQAVLSWANLREANLFKANLSRATAWDVYLFGANLTQARLSGAFLDGATLNKATLFRSNLTGARLKRASLFGANLTRADLSEADLSGADLSEADLSGANLTRTDLSGANLTEANLTEANLTSCRVYGISAWNPILTGAMQSDLIITPETDPVVTVDQLEVAQFVYLLLHNEKIRDVIDTVTSKTVLILGRFKPERKLVLDGLREQVRKHDLVPILFDFDIPADRDVTETVTLLARMARFVVADLTEPSSIPQELQAIVPDVLVPVQPLLQEGFEPWSMFVDLKRKYHWVLEIQHYRDMSDLVASLNEKVMLPVEAKRRELSTRPSTD
jgi:uncharacterized protein YjbI with pentapeptide repeats